MSRSTHARKPTRDPRLELQLWYLDSLQPKLLRAVDAGVIPPAAADELDRQVVEVLDLPRPEMYRPDVDPAA
jgi:hypothetical protein